MNKKTITTLIALFMFLNLANAQTVNHTFNYQGELMDNNVAITDTFNFTVQAYSDLQGTIPIGDLAEYKDANAVTVTKGLFNLENVDLGLATYDGMDIWLQISVKKPADVNYTALTPLQKMQSVPYATTLIDKGASQGQVLTFNDTSGWQPADGSTDDQNISGSGLSGTDLTIGIEGGASQVIDLFSLQDDKTVTITGGDGIVVTGIYPNYTVSKTPDLVAPPNCDQNNQSLQYNAATGWACVNNHKNYVWTTGSTNTDTFPIGTSWTDMPDLDLNPIAITTTGGDIRFGWNGIINCNFMSVGRCFYNYRILVDGNVCGNQSVNNGFGTIVDYEYNGANGNGSVVRDDSVEGVCSVPAGAHNLTMQYRLLDINLTFRHYSSFGKFLFWVEEL